jgi:hypothetical protein
VQDAAVAVAAEHHEVEAVLGGMVAEGAGRLARGQPVRADRVQASAVTRASRATSAISM